MRAGKSVQQIFDTHIDFGLIRKNAVAPGLKCLPLGNLAYVVVIPAMMVSGKSAPTFSQVVGAGQICFGNLEIQDGLTFGVISCFDDLLGFVSVRGGQAGAFAGRFVHAIEHLPVATVG